jgi:hypothetical protein
MVVQPEIIAADKAIQVTLLHGLSQHFVIVPPIAEIFDRG